MNYLSRLLHVAFDSVIGHILRLMTENFIDLILFSSSFSFARRVSLTIGQNDCKTGNETAVNIVIYLDSMYSGDTTLVIDFNFVSGFRHALPIRSRQTLL